MQGYSSIVFLRFDTKMPAKLICLFRYHNTTLSLTPFSFIPSFINMLWILLCLPLLQVNAFAPSPIMAPDVYGAVNTQAVVNDATETDQEWIQQNFEDTRPSSLFSKQQKSRDHHEWFTEAMMSPSQVIAPSSAQSRTTIGLPTGRADSWATPTGTAQPRTSPGLPRGGADWFATELSAVLPTNAESRTTPGLPVGRVDRFVSGGIPQLSDKSATAYFGSRMEPPTEWFMDALDLQ
jgi:hypothetical protein